MKLATLADGTRDGYLVVVSRDLDRCVDARSIAPTLQAALDDWAHAGPRLTALAADLANGRAASTPFDESNTLSPLPRAYQWADGSAYVNHVELVRRARGASLPESFWTDPLIYQGGSDGFLAPYAPIRVADEAFGIDLEGEIAVIVDDLPMGATHEQAFEAIRLIMLVNDVSLRGLIPDELAKGFGFFQSKPASSFSPIAITPDELGSAWRNAKVHRPLHVHINDTAFGYANAGVDMTFDFATLIAHAARTRDLGAGTIVGSGTVSNKLNGGPGKPIADGGSGYACIAELRMIETINHGAPSTSFLKFGDRIRIAMQNDSGRSIFGSINQTVTQS